MSEETPKSKKDWGSIISRNLQTPKIEMKPEAGDFQNPEILPRLIREGKRVNGLVVSIGVSAPRNSGAMPEAVRQMIRSLTSAGDFCTQRTDDEFLLIYPQEQGASAQKRLSLIAQQLWDFQLRSLGSFPILLSWGGVEAAGESLEEAMASANERMQETKRGRKLLTMSVPLPAAKPFLKAV
jgi:hypothetical protein